MFYDFRAMRQKQIWTGLLAFTLLFLSVALYRNQVRLDLHLTWNEAFDASMGRGLLYDVVVCLFPFAFWRLFYAILFIPGQVTWTVFALIAWFSGMMNIVYFRFFKQPMPWWIVTTQASDSTQVQGSFFDLANTWSIILGALCFAGSLFVIWYLARDQWKLVKEKHSVVYRRAATFTVGAFALTLTFLLRQSPVWMDLIDVGWLSRETVLSSQVLQNWWDENFSKFENVNKGRRDQFKIDRKQVSAEVGHILNQYRQYKTGAKLAEDTKKPFSLIHDRIFDPVKVAALRKRVGMPEKGPFNVVYLFLESVRSYELNHPELGPLIWPNLRRILGKNGIYYTQMYSSSFTAGQTVRGQFSTQCSMLPHLKGGATYINYPTLGISCIASYLKNNAFKTIWINSHKKTFHNKNMFESIHGMQEYYDRKHFEAKGITEKVGSWGIADHPVLDEAVNILVESAKDNQPMFANILTISTHHPFRFKGEISMPDELDGIKAENIGYWRYLGLLRYLDRALDNFFDRLFKSDIGENTLVVLLGDHGTYIQPTGRLSKIQRKEVEFRIPLAFISKNLLPRQINYSAHQVDVTPTVAAILGYPAKEVTWVGKNILDGPGSPWVYLDGERYKHFRDEEEACYTLPGWKKVKCWVVSENQDPLALMKLAPKKINASKVKFFSDLINANHDAISLDLLYPRKSVITQ